MQDIDGGGLITAASLLFAPGDRPGVAAVESLAAAAPTFSVTLFSAASGGDGAWAELVMQGLAFDLVGLAPGPSAPVPPRGHAIGFAAEEPPVGLEAVTLQLSPHLAEGAMMAPVTRALAVLAGQLSELPGVVAVAWHPARTWSAPALFQSSITRWIEGGAFPGLMLAALADMPDGGLESAGLALFAGQELHLAADVAATPAERAKIALRLMHWLVEHGPIDASETVAEPGGGPLLLEPSADLRVLRAWRG
jgi:hypothetical protein